jgi:MoxR-like ATPase
VPRLGEIRAAPGFLVIATQNPKEFVATSHLSEAILDRFELVVLDYQTEEEEVSIVQERLKDFSKKSDKLLPLASVRLARLTRNHPRVKRGASVRAALSVAEIAAVLMEEGKDFKQAFIAAALMALPTRIEIERDADSARSARADLEELLREWSESVLSELHGEPKQKKK